MLYLRHFLYLENLPDHEIVNDCSYHGGHTANRGNQPRLINGPGVDHSRFMGKIDEAVTRYRIPEEPNKLPPLGEPGNGEERTPRRRNQGGNQNRPGGIAPDQANQVFARYIRLRPKWGFFGFRFNELAMVGKMSTVRIGPSPAKGRLLIMGTIIWSLLNAP